MTSENTEIQVLANQLKEWSIEMDLLAAKQEAAAVATKKFAEELDALRLKYRVAARHLRELEMEENGSSMWENIGDGG